MIKGRELWCLGIATAALLVAVAPASAEVQTKTYKYGPLTVGGYEVSQNASSVQAPQINGSITKMSVDIVDESGKQVPIQRLMLHHVVFGNIGPRIGSKFDRTCKTFTNLDSVSKTPALGERFYAAGEERAVMDLPPGYGYKTNSKDRWFMVWMLMNHRKVADTAYIQYTVTIDDSPSLQPVTPYWLDVANCWQDPVYDVAGGGTPGSDSVKSVNWVPDQSGRIVAATGHVHGGGKSLSLRRTQCSPTSEFKLDPLWGNPDHPFYNVKPILHEPGPISMERLQTEQGIPVRAGEQLKFDSTYDGELPHTRVMGITVAYVAPPDGRDTGAACPPPPTDLREIQSDQPGRALPPRFKVPLIGLDRSGKAREIASPPGKARVLKSGSTINVGDLFFDKRNIVVKRGAKLRWRFGGDTLHNLTLANGPEGFSSPNYDNDRTYTKKFTRPGKYQFFCGLHPVSMTQQVVVR